MSNSSTVAELLQAIFLVDQSIALLETQLASNPSTDEERTLRRNLLRLQAERAVLEAELDAALDNSTGVQAPSTGQLAEIEGLLNRVEAATNSAVSAAQGIRLTTRVLELVTKVVTSP
jgi:C4-type Zn-finger protein